MRNAILEKEIKLGSRTVKFPIAIVACATVMNLVAISILSMSISMGDMYYDAPTGDAINYAKMSECFSTFSTFQAFVMCIIIPIITASSIAGEREKQTLDILLTAPISPLSIVTGKLMAALCNVMMYIFSALPAICICCIFGGYDVTDIALDLLYLTSICFMVGAVGVFCSAVFNKTVVSIVMCLLIEGLILVAPIIITCIAVYFKEAVALGSDISPDKISYGLLPLGFMLSPNFANFMNLQKSARMSIYLFNNLQHAKMPIGVKFFVENYTLTGIVVAFIYGIFFVLFAARIVDSARLKGKTMRKKDLNMKKNNERMNSVEVVSGE